jgi:precorrin-2 dehydrogenase / sirohydrochlorin ferrochelatase
MRMLPIIVDVKRSAIAVIGEGPQTLKRLAILDGAGAGHVRVFAPSPSPELSSAAANRLAQRWPTGEDLEHTALVFVGDLPPDRAERFFVLGRGKGALVNVEDQRDFCDFHIPSIVRRGDLLISVSTGGRSPALAQMIRARIGLAFGPEWEGHLDAIADLRAGWRAAGLSPAEISRHTEAAAAAAGWFDAAGALALPEIDTAMKAQQ